MSNNKTIVITGASDGIGLAAAKSLKEQGHNIVIVGRNPQKTLSVAKELDAPCHIADYSRLSDVVRLADELKAYPQIDVLANNAGALFDTLSITEDGFERTFQVNVLSAFLLTNILAEKLCDSRATVIQTTSIAANFYHDFTLEDIETKKSYTPMRAYAHSKLCNVIFTRELHRRFHSKGINSVAFEPGISRSNFASEGNFLMKTAFHSPLKYLFTVTPEESAKRLVRLATGEAGVDFISGEIYSYKKPFRVKTEKESEFWDKCKDMTTKGLAEN